MVSPGSSRVDWELVLGLVQVLAGKMNALSSGQEVPE
jgi:hypothetical protein